MQVRKRYVGGAAIVVGLALYLSQFMGGFGTGSGLDTGTEPAESVGSNEVANKNENSTDLNNVSATGDLETTMMNSSKEEPQKYITITIHQDRYRLTDDQDPMTGADISQTEVVNQAKKATGGEQGIKVRVLRQKNAHVGAKLELYKALSDAGVKREEIQEISGFVD